MRDDVRFGLVGMLPSAIRRWSMTRRYRRDVEGGGEAELKHLREFVKNGDVAVDVGCNIGDYSYELGRLTGNVVAFEPNPYVYRFVRSLKLPGVDLRQVALSDDAGSARLSVPARVGGHGLGSLRDMTTEAASVESFEVATERLDALGLGKVAFIKIDVEGFEEAVLEGGKETIARDHPTLLIEIEERHNPGGLARIRQRLQALGYNAWFLRDETWSPADKFDAGIDQKREEVANGDRDRGGIRYINNFLFVQDSAMPVGHA